MTEKAVVRFNSITEEVKELIDRYMENGKTYERKELVQFIRENIQNKETLTDGIIAGAIKIKGLDGSLVTVARGVYRKGIKLENLTMRERVMAILDDFQKDLNKACTANLLNVTDEEVGFIRKVNELSNEIESRIWKMEESTVQKAEEPVGPEKAEVKPGKATANKKAGTV